MAMFSAKNEKQTALAPGGLSVIASGMTVRGDVDSDGTVKVEGTVEGHVQARHQVLVAKGGSVEGDIDARESIVGGTVQGAIRATERVEVQAGATVRGDVTTKRIAVAEGANLNGSIHMSEATPEVRTESKPPQKHEQKGSTATAVVPSMARPSVPVARVAVPPRLPGQGSGH